jgi:D-alanyl-lipoteichoic acid acyltransferase DltB (MBOAT superfamily)
MLFNSIDFVVFFIVVTAVYYLLPHKYRWLHLLLASCIFYMAFVPIYILILFATIIIDYFAGIYIEKTSSQKKLFLIFSLIANIGVLVVFKYYNFFIDNVNALSGADIPLLNILLPIGLSFHTFQAMSYTIEVYRGNQKAEKHFGIYALYVMFYPQLVAGPIERPQNILHQFHEKKSFSYENVVSGMKMMAWGLFKKVVIADRLAVYVNEVFDHYGSYQGLPVLIAIVFFALQIYFDFSAYSDIALGSARTLGFNLMVNFKNPYFSTSISEFWSRWHISLSTWFRDYLYIPLGGNRISGLRTRINLIIVFLVSGLWHGANWTFLFWGGLHGAFVSLENIFRRIKLSEKIPVIIKRISVLTLVCTAWVFFRAESFHQATELLRSSAQNLLSQTKAVILNTDLARLKFLYANKESSVFALALVFSVFALSIEGRLNNTNIVDYFSSLKRPVRYSMYFFLIYGTIVFGVFGKTQFIYFQF